MPRWCYLIEKGERRACSRTSGEGCEDIRLGARVWDPGSVIPSFKTNACTHF